MNADWEGPGGEGLDEEPPPPEGPSESRPYGSRPYGSRPYGSRPYGSRPYGSRPYGSRPYGSRPYGSRPYGSRPYGSRPYGSRPYGSRPYGSRPYGSRPYGSRDDSLNGGGLDPDEWSADIAGLFCEISAVVRLAASVAHGENEIRVPAVRPGTSPQYLDQPSVTDPGEEQKTAESKEKPAAGVGQQRLRPREHELAWKVVIPNRLARDIFEDPSLEWAMKEDVATALAVTADRAFLNGPGGDAPLGIASSSDAFASVPPPATPLDLVRNMVAELRARPQAYFRRPGWVLGPETLDLLARTPERAGRDLDSTRLLTLDGEDGGVLLGYPFVATEAADGRTYLSADWREAWIGVDRELVRIDISTDTAFQSDETVVRAVMHHDFLVRRPRSFIHVDPIAAPPPP